MTSSSGLCGTSFTLEWLLDRLRHDIKVTESQSRLVTHEVNRIGVGQGFLSHIVCVKLTWAGENKDEMPTAVVLKIPTADTLKGHIEDMDFSQVEGMSKEDVLEQMEGCFLPLAHRNECKLYELWAHESPVQMPKVYYSKTVESLKEGTAAILMQDFSTLGAVTPNIADGLNLAQLHAIFDNIASMHAWSVRNQGKFEDEFLILPKEEFEKWPATLTTISRQLIEMDPSMFTHEQFNEVMWAVQPDYVYNAAMKYNQKYTGIQPLFVHGDLWTNNMLFHGTTGELMAIIDFQVAHAGSCAEDMCRVLFSSVRGDLRRKETNNLLKFYYERLTQKLAPQKPPFTLEDVHRSFELVAPFSVFFYLFGVPIMSNSAVVEGPNKEEKVHEMLLRAQMGLHDIAKYKDTVQTIMQKLGD